MRRSQTALEALNLRISFGVLERAQVLGDRQALLDRGRKVICFHIEDDLQIGMRRLIRSLGTQV